MTPKEETESAPKPKMNIGSNRQMPAWAQGVPTKLIKKVNIIEETPTSLPVHTLTFAMPCLEQQQHENYFTGPAIHHSLLKLDMGDVVKMVIPGYKPKSYSVSELRKNEFDVTFKVYPNGRASGFLNSLKAGDSIQSFGKHASRKRNAASYHGIVVFGVGITEGLPLAVAELAKGDAHKVVLLWASRTLQDTFWNDKILKLKQQYGDKFEVVYMLSRQEPPADTDAIKYLHGRITPDVLRKVFQPPEPSEARFQSVGTKEMMKCVDDMLTGIGYPVPEQHLLPKVK